MKYLFVLFSILLFISCNKEDQNPCKHNEALLPESRPDDFNIIYYSSDNSNVRNKLYPFDSIRFLDDSFYEEDRDSAWIDTIQLDNVELAENKNIILDSAFIVKINASAFYFSRGSETKTIKLSDSKTDTLDLVYINGWYDCHSSFSVLEYFILNGDTTEAASSNTLFSIVD